ncbi:MAG: glycosyltransferase family 4 protein [Kofleriaceae bacterium]
MSTSTRNPRRLLYVVSEDWYFLSHRLPMARAARAAGFEVHVATRVQHGANAIRAEGFVLHAVPFERGRLSIAAAMRTVRALRAVYDVVDPSIAHHVSLQPAVLASLAAVDRNVACVNAFTGFGYAFSSNAGTARVLRPMIGGALRLLLNRGTTVALVQNPDDEQTLRSLGVSHRRIVRICGSGVELERFSPTPEPNGPIVIGYAGRLLEDKGIHTLVQAHGLLRRRGLLLQLKIAGAPDPANPSSIKPEQLEHWRTLPGVQLLGHVSDIPEFWANSHIAVLPSRREGLPKSMLEAAACGRPMIATDAPGCREVVIPGETGRLVPIDNTQALASAIAELAQSTQLRYQFGTAARRLAERRFGTVEIASQTVALYETLFASSTGRR